MANKETEIEVINSKVSIGAYAPKAWVIADFSQDEKVECFELSENPDKLSRQIRTDKNISVDSLTSADRFISRSAARLNNDPIGGEDFSTIFDSSLLMSGMGASVSLHEMLLGAKASQRFHYHPPTGQPVDLTTSIRQVLLYPLYDKKSGNGGVKFEWFELENSGIQKNDNEAFPRAIGEPVGKKHVVEAEPGQVILVEFGKGVHHFGGLGFALSAHFHDKKTGSRLGSFLGNTAAWDSKKSEPLEIEKVSFDGGSSNAMRKQFNDLGMLVGYHELVLRNSLEKHLKDNPDGKPLHHKRRSALINDLRAE